MNEKGKKWLKHLNNLLITSLEENISNITVFQDSLTEDEFDSLGNEYHYIIFETLGMERPRESNRGVIQRVLIRYYSEGKDNLDETMLDIISTLESNKHTFIESDKFTIQKDKTDDYIDALEFTFTRVVHYGRC